MKKNFSILVFCFLASHSFAQGLKIKKGFYLNPNFNHTSYRSDAPHSVASPYYKVPLFAPNLTVGFLWGQKNRHNIALTSLGGVVDRYYQNAYAQLRYNYDILAFRKNKFSFYVSPYVAAGWSYYKTGHVTATNITYLTYTFASLSAGIAPVFEYKLGKRIDFVASLPLELYRHQYSKVTDFVNSQPQLNEYNRGHLLNNGQARIGMRLNLFRK